MQQFEIVQVDVFVCVCCVIDVVVGWCEFWWIEYDQVELFVFVDEVVQCFECIGVELGCVFGVEVVGYDVLLCECECIV